MFRIGDNATKKCIINHVSSPVIDMTYNVFGGTLNFTRFILA